MPRVLADPHFSCRAGIGEWSDWYAPRQKTLNYFFIARKELRGSEDRCGAVGRTFQWQKALSTNKVKSITRAGPNFFPTAHSAQLSHQPQRQTKPLKWNFCCLSTLCLCSTLGFCSHQLQFQGWLRDWLCDRTSNTLAPRWLLGWPMIIAPYFSRSRQIQVLLKKLAWQPTSWISD